MIKFLTFVYLLILTINVNGYSLTKDQPDNHFIQGLDFKHSLSGSNYPFKTNGSEGYYLSSQGLGKLKQVQRALTNILSKIEVQKTVYVHFDQTKFTIDNFVLEKLKYNDVKQQMQINRHGEVTVTNGTIFFGYSFNYSIQRGDKIVQGWAEGSAYSDALTYKKQLIINEYGALQWALLRTDAYKNLDITRRMSLERMKPYDKAYHTILIEMLNKDSSKISPTNIKSQLLKSFNSQFFSALNHSVDHEVFGQSIDYSYQHPTKGLLNMTIIHQLYYFSVQENDGYTVIFVPEIDGYKEETTCDATIPYNHSDFKIYGGIQSLHLNCIYQDVVNFIHAQGWLDTKLNSDWEVKAFKFYAENLYDVIDTLSTRVNPKSLLEGQCKANKNNLVLKSSKQFIPNTYELDIDYNCTVRTTDKSGETLDILQFVAITRSFIKASADKLALNFQIVDADVLALSFTPVNNFVVTNMMLALFKATTVLKKNLNWKVFGTGFPSLPRKNPMTKVDKDSVIYYEAPATEEEFQIDQKLEVI